MLLLLLQILVSSVAGEEIRIHTTSGDLLGKRISVLDNSLNVFLGVPFASPPTGERRFQYAIPLNTEGVEREAKAFAPSCYQPIHASEVISPLLKPNKIELSEDCLYLNVYAPVNQAGHKLPVMVWLAGEGFNYADPHQFDVKYLAALGNVIVVTINYRVSVFGFLSTLSEHAPGNVGLYDQRLGLKWVQQNIAGFGGNPAQVTLFGRLTGAMSTAIHAFSPLSKSEKLFQRIILHSGVPDGDWVFDRNPLNSTFALAEAVGCTFPEIAEMLDCLRRIPADVLLQTALPVANAWRPVYDFNLIYEDTLKSANSSSYNPVPVLIGLNIDEGSLCLAALKATRSDFYDKLIKKTLNRHEYEILLYRNLLVVYRENDDLVNKLSVHEYQGNNVAGLRNDFVKFCGDLFVNAHVGRLADILSLQKQKVYLYELAHRPSFSIHPAFIRAAHGDDVLYALGLPLQLDALPREDEVLTRKLVQTVSNFAMFGNPNAVNSSVWPLYTHEEKLLMEFHGDHEEAKVKKTTHDRAVEFWKDIVAVARKRSCPLPPISSALHSIQESDPKGAPPSSWMTVPAAGYMMLALMCTVGLLFITTVVALGLMVKFRRQAIFQRLG